jgi:magnesium-transporting ATPase (P-type)
VQTPLTTAHARSVAEVSAALESDPGAGLSVEEARARLARVGPNALPEAPRSSLLRVFVHQFQSPLVYLLLVAAGVALLLGEHSDAIVIVVVVALNAGIGTFQEGRAERSLAALRSVAQQRARVVRGGREIEIAARELVPGDVISLQAGDAIGADARVIEAAQLSVAEAALTGESVPVQKTPAQVAETAPLAERGSMLFAGTHLTAGRGRALVVATGSATEIGMIAQLAESAEQAKTPLEARVAQFGRVLSYAALATFGLISGVGLLRQVPFSELVMVGISQVVGMIPEGLPVAMTIALALGVTRMAQRGAIVRKLAAVETLGSTTVIASDKTGTLTRNEMTVTRVVLADGRALDVEGSGYAPAGALREGSAPRSAADDAALRELLEACVLCNDAELEAPQTGAQGYRPLGDPTEAALLVVARKGGLDTQRLRAAYPRRAEVPFDSAKKWMATQHERAGRPFVVLKGAPEVLLPIAAGGSCELERDAQQMAERALRVIAVAQVDGATLVGEDAPLPAQARLLGLVGELDPPRAEVAEAVRRCKLAGVRPVMITGDHKATGVAIAEALAITEQGREAVDGAELARMDDAELDRRLARIDVFARVEPAQKLRIVEAYQRHGAVVAMTGDGVNDAPALVRADVGVAMGITGTEVAKQAARIVITDDNFATIVAAVEEGRVVYRNLQKALLLLLSTSIAEVVVLSGALIVGLPPPFAAVQILWNNLITEGLITVNLVMEPGEGDEMQRPPIPRAEGLLSRALRARMYLLTPVIALVNLAWFAGRLHAGIPFSMVQSETFTLLAVCEWFNVLNCRSATASALRLSLRRNPWLLAGLAAGIALQAAVLYASPLRALFHTEPLGLRSLLWIVALGSLVLWVEEARKWWARRRTPRSAGLPRGLGATQGSSL